MWHCHVGLTGMSELCTLLVHLSFQNEFAQLLDSRNRMEAFGTVLATRQIGCVGDFRRGEDGGRPSSPFEQQKT